MLQAGGRQGYSSEMFLCLACFHRTISRYRCAYSCRVFALALPPAGVPVARMIEQLPHEGIGPEFQPQTGTNFI